jgi:two-component sensor histidine kinase/putative methionine-R-sulfoxide reductase with GAF domain
MADTTLSPLDAMLAFLDARAASADDDGTVGRRAAYRLGEAAAAADLTIEEAFELLESEAAEILPELSAELLGSIVRGYVDRVVRVRGLTKRRGTGRLSSHVARLAALHRINRAATGSLHLDDMLSTVVAVVAETIGGDACSVFLYDHHSQTLMLRASSGLNPDIVGKLSIRADAGITGLAAASRQTQIAVDAPSHPAFFTYPIVGEDRYTSQVSIPLLLREPERLVGVMNIQSIHPREFDQDEITFLETAAGELSIAIENARLYSQTDAALHMRIAELDALQSVTRSIASTLRSGELLPLIASQSARLTDADAAFLFRVIEPPDHVKLLVQVLADDTNANAMVPVEFVQEVARVRSGLALAEPQAAGSEGMILGAPLMTGHGVLGVVCVRLRTRIKHPDQPLALLQAFADSAALALENADLYEDARQNYATASTLLQEMHHRVRNNLQTVAALLSMQARHARAPEITGPLQEAVARVQSIAAVHNLLSSDNVTTANIAAVVKHVVDEASINVVPPGMRVAFDIQPTTISASSRQATILALLVNECVTNAIEHGFMGRTEGRVTITTSEIDELVEVAVVDDGIGLPADFSLERNSQLGLRIARTLAASDLKGSFGIESRPGGGARAVIRFPKASYAPASSAA